MKDNESRIYGWFGVSAIITALDMGGKKQNVIAHFHVFLMETKFREDQLSAQILSPWAYMYMKKQVW